MISRVDNHKLLPEQVTCETTASRCLIVRWHQQREDLYPKPDLQVGNILRQAQYL